MKSTPEINTIVDGENYPIQIDSLYSLKVDNLTSTMEQISNNHQSDVYFLPLSGKSAGGGIFHVPAPDSGEIIGLQIVPTPQPRIRHGNAVDITQVQLDEIIIDAGQRQVYAGSSVTLEQLNQALCVELGGQYKVLGADLTSYTYAQVGATFMTGGMGPQRRYFSDSVTGIALYDGKRIVSFSGKDIEKYAGTYGWSGLVTAVCCRYVELPGTEIAFAIPVNHSPANLARLLQHFSQHTFLQVKDNKVCAIDGSQNIILGLEQVTTAAMQPLFKQPGNAISRRAKRIEQKCKIAEVDGLIFVSGYSNLATDDFLFSLVDDKQSEDLSIAGIDLEYTDVFSDPEQMRAVREAIPFAARTQALAGRYTFKGHTDANIRLAPDNVELAMQLLWQANQNYVESIESHFNDNDEINGEILVYGHLNPYGVDPHNRVTFSCDQHTEYANAQNFIASQTNNFLCALQGICESTGSVFIGGEKSAASEAKMFSAFNDHDSAPPALTKKFEQQIKAIRSASPLFNWRALAPYR